MEELERCALQELESARAVKIEALPRPFPCHRETPLAVLVACTSLAMLTAVQLGFVLLLLATPNVLCAFEEALVVMGFL